MVLSYSCLPLRFYRSLLDAPPVNCEPCRILRLALKYVNTIDRHLSKGDLEKLKITVRLRNETLVTVAWIAQRLQMGSTANVNTLLYR